MSQANGSGAGVARGGPATDAALEAAAVPDGVTARGGASASEGAMDSASRSALPQVSIDPEEPAPGEELRELAPLRLPALPDEAADVARWERPRDLVTLGECLVEMTRRPDGAYQPSIAGDVFNAAFYGQSIIGVGVRRSQTSPNVT